MVVRRASYPQVDPRAAGLMTGAIVVAPKSLAVAEAEHLARRRRARLVVSRVGAGWAGVTPDTLGRSVRLGLDGAPLKAVLWGMPVVEADAPEVTVRRRLGPATPFALVEAGGVPIGAVLAETGTGNALPLAVQSSLARLPDAVTRVLRQAGRVGDRLGVPVMAVGGLVRDLLLGQTGSTRVDLDLVVEGDGPALARRLAEELGSGGSTRVREHTAFLTASLELPHGLRVDVATARRESYRAPGALPDVEPASIVADLWRRDLSINALAVRLDGDAWGQLLDPTGGLRDLRSRRIRVLHPLSFIEDPTRMFRAVRFAIRFGGRFDATTRRLLSEAASLTVYEALSGDRLRAEFVRVLDEAAPQAVLERLGRLGAFRIVLPGYRLPPSARVLLGATARAEALPIARPTREALHVLALTAHLRVDRVARWTARLALSAATRTGVARARAESLALLAKLGEATGPAQAYRVLRDVPELVAAWAYVETAGSKPRRSIVAYLRRWRAAEPLLTGEDLKALGLRPGPGFRRLLEDGMAAQVAGRFRRKYDAVAWVRGTVSRRGRVSGEGDVLNHRRSRSDESSRRGG